MICSGCKKEIVAGKTYRCSCGMTTYTNETFKFTEKSELRAIQTVYLDAVPEKPSDLPKQVEQWLDQFSAKENKNE